jgi:hypothetical protein
MWASVSPAMKPAAVLMTAWTDGVRVSDRQTEEPAGAADGLTGPAVDTPSWRWTARAPPVGSLVSGSAGSDPRRIAREPEAVARGRVRGQPRAGNWAPETASGSVRPVLRDEHSQRRAPRRRRNAGSAVGLTNPTGLRRPARGHAGRVRADRREARQSSRWPPRTPIRGAMVAPRPLPSGRSRRGKASRSTLPLSRPARETKYGTRYPRTHDLAVEAFVRPASATGVGAFARGSSASPPTLAQLTHCCVTIVV